MSSFAQLLRAFDPAAPLDVPASWMQGHTAYGGLTTALAIQSLLASQPALPPLRAVNVSFIDRTTGPVSFVPSILRTGRSVVNASVDVMSGGLLATRVGVLFAHPRPSQVRHDFYAAPQVKPPAACRPLLPAQMAAAPVFVQNFEMRPAGGAAPLSGAAHPELLLWVRHVDADDANPLIALIGLADALPPAAITAFPAPAPLSSLTWTFDVFASAPAGSWMLMRSFSRRANDGYSIEEMEIWSEEGVLLLSGRQTVAIFT